MPTYLPLGGNPRTTTAATIEGLPADLRRHVLRFVATPRQLGSLAQVSKGWGAALAEVEEELWLGLVRLHYPTLEDLNGLRGDEGECWKKAFERKLRLMRWRTRQPVISDTIPRGETQGEPRPLTAYHFELVLTCYKKTLDGEKEVARTIARLVRDDAVSYGDIGYHEVTIQFVINDMDEIFDETERYSDVEVTLILIEKESGRQAVWYNQFVMDDVMRDDGDGETLDLSAKAHVVMNIPWLREEDSKKEIYTMAGIQRRRCTACQCPWFDGENYLQKIDRTIFDRPRCDCCSCDRKWQCFSSMKMGFNTYCDHGLDVKRHLKLIELLDFE